MALPHGLSPAQRAAVRILEAEEAVDESQLPSAQRLFSSCRPEWAAAVTAAAVRLPEDCGPALLALHARRVFSQHQRLQTELQHMRTAGWPDVVPVLEVGLAASGGSFSGLHFLNRELAAVAWWFAAGNTAEAGQILAEQEVFADRLPAYKQEMEPAEHAAGVQTDQEAASRRAAAAASPAVRSARAHALLPAPAAAQQAGSSQPAGINHTSATEPFPIFVRVPDGRSVCLEACLQEPVSTIIDRALQRSSCRRLPWSSLYVSCDGKPLQPLSPLAAYPCIGTMSTLILKPNVAAIRSEPILPNALHIMYHKLALGSDLTWRSKAEAGDALFCLRSVAKAKEFNEQDVQLVAAAAKVLVELACNDDSSHWLQWLLNCSEALLCHFRLALKLAPANLAPCIACLRAALLATTPVLECSARDVSGIPSEFINRWALDLLKELKTAAAPKAEHWRPDPLKLPDPNAVDKRWRCRLLGSLLDASLRLLNAAARTISSALTEGWHRSRLTQREAWLEAGVQGATEIAALLPLFGVLHSWPRDLSTFCCSGLDAICRQLGHALNKAAPPGGPPFAHRPPRDDGLRAAAKCVVMVLSAMWAISEAEPTHQARHTLVAAAQGLLEHPAVQAVLSERPAQEALHRGICKDPVLRDVIPVSAKIASLRRYSDEQSELQAEEEGEDDEATLYIERAELVESSYNELLPVPRWCLTRHMWVEFIGEPGVGEGVTREWLTLLAAQLFQPNLGLFVRCTGNPLALMPSPAASVQPNHAQYLQVAGRVMGLCLLHGVPLGFHLAGAFHRCLLNDDDPFRSRCATMLEDLKEVDEQLWSTFASILEAPREELACMGLTFSIAVDQLGQAVEVPLGDEPELEVTAANREEYVRLALQHVLYARVADEVAAFLKGLVDVLKQNPLDMFSRADFNQLLAGSAGIGAVEEWRQHTRCQGWDGWEGPEASARGDQMAVDGASEEPQVLRWFWVLVGHMTEAQRQSLLFFWTSLRSLPSGGFAALPQKPVIVCASHATQRLPQAQTCFYQLLLPDYPDVLSLAAGLHEALANKDGYGML